MIGLFGCAADFLLVRIEQHRRGIFGLHREVLVHPVVPEELTTGQLRRRVSRHLYTNGLVAVCLPGHRPDADGSQPGGFEVSIPLYIYIYRNTPQHTESELPTVRPRVLADAAAAPSSDRKHLRRRGLIGEGQHFCDRNDEVRANHGGFASRQEVTRTSSTKLRCK